MDRLGFVTGSVVAVRSQPTAENGDVIVARLEDEDDPESATVRDGRAPCRSCGLRAPIRSTSRLQVDLESDVFEIAGIAVGALIGDGFNGPEHENWVA